MKERLELVGLIILALIACTWAWLTKMERDDPNYGSEEDEGFEVAEVEERKREHEQTRLGNNVHRFGRDSDDRLLDRTGNDRMRNDIRQTTTRSTDHCTSRE